jgi:transmembrane sensor
MDMKNKTDWSLLTRFVTGEAGASEVMQIEEWRNQSEENNLLLNDLKNDQKMIDDYRKIKQVDVDKAWNNVLSRISTEKQEYAVKAKNVDKKRLIPVFLRVAASVAVLVGLYFALRLISQSNEFYTAWSTGTDTMVTLPDGSKVYLNSNTRVKYPKEFNNQNREIFLDGEAFFEVVANAEKPFVVSAGKSNVRVLGTSFLVKKTKNGVKVFVESGKVSFYEKGKETSGVLLHPGEIGIHEKDMITSEKNTNRNIVAWKTKKIVFTDENFTEIADVLKDVYNVNIKVKNPEKGNCPRAVKFIEGQTLQEVLRVLGTEAYTFKTEYSGNNIIIELQGCK